MKLYISEKPTVNKAIAEYVAKSSGQEMRTVANNVFKVGDNVFVPLAGHVLRLKDIVEYEGYEKFRWNQLDLLPIIPSPFKKAVNFDVKDGKRDTTRHNNILKNVKFYLESADEVVNVGDPDDEGQYLVDEVLEYFNYQGPVLRLWTSGLGEDYLKKSFANIVPNDVYFSKGLAAKARAESDWLFGINFTILFSEILSKTTQTTVMTPTGTKTKKTGTNVFSVGRVQSPVLNLIYEREQEYENFKPIDYYNFSGLVNRDNQDMKVNLDMRNQELLNWLQDKGAIDEENRLISKDVASEIAESFGIGRQYPVTKAEFTDKKESAPLALSLAELLKECGKKFDLSVAETQDIASDLYLAKYITYPRNKDCRHLEEADFASGPRIVGSLKAITSLEGITDKTYEYVDTSYKGSKVWNDKEVAKAAHPAIVPTGELDTMDKFNALSIKHRQVYSLIARYYLYQFMQPATYKQFKGEVSHDNLSRLKLTLSGKQWLQRNWKDAFSDVDDDVDEDENTLPSLKQGDLVNLVKFDINARKTTRPKLYNDVSLLDAMINADRYVRNDELRSILRGKSDANSEEYSIPSGIGTDSTRATIITTLGARKLVTVDDKGFFRVSDKGKELLKYMPNELRWVDLTAEWQKNFDDLRKIENLDSYKLQYNNLLNAQVMKLKNLFNDTQKHLKDNTGFVAENITKTGEKCPKCGDGDIIEREYMYNGEAIKSLSCEHCKTRFKRHGDELVETIRKKTDFKCGKCDKSLIEYKGRNDKGDYHYFACEDDKCRKFYSVGENGEPCSNDAPLTDHLCEKCESKLYHIKFNKTNEDGTVKNINMFKCSNEQCQTLYSATEDDMPIYPVYLNEPCPYCGSKVEHVQGTSKEGKPYNFAKCVNTKCKTHSGKGGGILSLDSSNKLKIKRIQTPCPNCGKAEIIYSSFAKKDDASKIYHKYQCNACSEVYWGDENGFKDPFEPTVNQFGNTVYLVKDMCKKCGKHHIQCVKYNEVAAAEKKREGYYVCSDKNCKTYHNKTENGFEISLPKKSS